MLTIELLGEEHWDDEDEVFRYPAARTLQFEHSLVSLSKWEEIYEKPFLAPTPPSTDEMYDYIYCMLLTPDVPQEDLNTLTHDQLQLIGEYINKPMSGTTVKEIAGRKGAGELISAELVHYWMNAANIDKEYETWHLNKLFQLIKIHDAKNQPAKKMNRQERVQSMAEQNKLRRAKLGTTG